MAISFVAGSYSQAANATSRTPSEPSGAADNDLIVAYGTAAQSVTWTDPADFTELNQKVTTAGSPTTTNYLGYKVRSGGAGSGYAFSHNGTSSNIAVQLLCFRGIDTTTPIDVTFVEASHYLQGTANTANMTPKAITTVTDNAWVVVIYATTQTISGAAGVSSGYAAADADNLTAATSNRGIFCYHKEIASNGTESPGITTHTDVTGTADPRTYTIAIRPAAAIAATKPNRILLLGVG